MVSDLLKKRYEEIFDDNYHRLYLLARRFVHNEEDAEDIVADVFYDLWRRINDIDLNGGITTYLYRAVSSRALNHLRHQNVAAVRIETLEAINEKRLEFVSKENLEDIIHSKEIKKAIGLALTAQALCDNESEGSNPQLHKKSSPKRAFGGAGGIRTLVQTRN